MRRGELYLVKKQGSQDPKRQRVLVSLLKAILTHLIGRLNDERTGELDRALVTALDLQGYAWGEPVGPAAFGPQPRA